MGVMQNLVAAPAHAYQSFYEADTPVVRHVRKVAARIEAGDRSEEAANSSAPARGILVGLALCAPLWIGLYVMVF
jgi:hypothetical protein